MEILEARNISVSDLPDCYAKEQLVDMVDDPTTARINVVAVKGGINDWSAYIGFPTSINVIKEGKRVPSMLYYVLSVSTAEGVASNGDKLSRETAAVLFPSIAKMYSYRH